MLEINRYRRKLHRQSNERSIISENLLVNSISDLHLDKDWRQSSRIINYLLQLTSNSQMSIQLSSHHSMNQTKYDDFKNMYIDTGDEVFLAKLAKFQ